MPWIATGRAKERIEQYECLVRATNLTRFNGCGLTRQRVENADARFCAEMCLNRLSNTAVILYESRNTVCIQRTRRIPAVVSKVVQNQVKSIFE